MYVTKNGMEVRSKARKGGKPCASRITEQSEQESSSLKKRRCIDVRMRSK